MWEFYSQCVKRAVKPAWDQASLVAGLVGIGVGLVLLYRPKMNDSLAPLAGTVPLSAFLGVFAWQFIKAPFQRYRELEDASRSLSEAMTRKVVLEEERANAAEEALKDYRDFQGIADYLTGQYHYGVHNLQHQPPADAEALPQWQEWVDNWYKAIVLKMKEFRCTPQDINHVETISSYEVLSALPPAPKPPTRAINSAAVMAEHMAYMSAMERRKIDIPVMMHAIRCGRIAEISTKYAKKAEDLRSPATR